MALFHRMLSKLPPRRLLKIYITVSFCNFCAVYNLTMLFPFLPFMVELLLPWIIEEDVATYAAIIVFAVLFGRIFGSYVWGALADWKGRKPVVIASIVLTGLSAFVFGFSINYEMALILRLAAGLSNGVIPVSKAIVSEISDDSNQAFGVAVLGTAWGLAVVIGPALSAAISDPIKQYNLTIENDLIREYLTRFPYSPPCTLTALLCVIAAILAAIVLPETLASKNGNLEETQQTTDLTSNSADEDNLQLEDDGDSKLLLKNSQSSSSSHENENLDPDDRKLLTVETDQHSDIYDVESKTAPRAKIKNHRKKLFTRIKIYFKRVYGIVFGDRATGLSLLIYVVYSSINVSFNDIYSVWAKTSPHLGGLGFRLNEIGITLTISGIAMVPSSLILFPLFEKKLGLLKTYYVQLIICIPALMLLPNIHYVYNIKWLLWLLLLSCMIVIQSCVTIAFSCVTSMINNSVLFKDLGTVNGIGSSGASFTRCVCILLSGKLFSVSLSATAAGLSYPLDYRLVFLLFGLVFVVCVFIGSCLPADIDRQKR